MMKYQQSLVIFALVLCQGHQGWADDIKGLMLTQQWLPTYCSTLFFNMKEFCSVVHQYEQWSIHGLWPYTSGGSLASEKIPPTPLNDHEIASLSDQLSSKWVDVKAVNKKSMNMRNFWEAEWQKHGVYADNPTGKNAQFNYFKNSLALFDQYNMSIILGRVGIVPGNEYSYQHLKREIEEALGKKCQIGCLIYPVTKELDPKNLPKQYLTEIRICFDDKEHTLIDCNPASSQSCITSTNLNIKIIYPTASYIQTNPPAARAPTGTNWRNPPAPNAPTGTNWRNPPAPNAPTGTNWRNPPAPKAPTGTSWRNPPVSNAPTGTNWRNPSTGNAQKINPNSSKGSTNRGRA